MVMINIIVNDNEVREFLKEMPNKIFNQTKTVIFDAVFRTHAIVDKNTKTKLHLRTGALNQSIKYVVTGNDLNSLRGSVWSDKIYAPIHEVGGIVRPKNNKYMRVHGGPYINIPLSFNKNSIGITRFTARQVFSAGGYIAKSKLGNWLVFSYGNKPMFVLVKSAKIPKRLGMRDAQEKTIPQLLYDLERMMG